MTRLNRILSFTLLMGVLALLFPVSAVGEEEVPVGAVIDLHGRLDYSRLGGPWYAGYRDMVTCLRDRLRTGEDSVATLEFDLGGRVGLKPGTLVEVVGEREVREAGGLRRLILRAGGIWARVTRRKQSLQVQTSGGVMGIKGTEFVVEETERATVVAVLEGEVEFTTSEGEVVDLPAGTKLQVLRDAPYVKTYHDPEELRREFREAWGEFYRIAGPVIVAAGGGSHLYYADMAVDLVTDPAAAAADYAASEVSRRVPVGGGFLGGMVRGAARSSPPPPDFPTGLQPDRKSLGNARPVLTWSPLEGAAGYAVLLGRDEDMADLVWTAATKGTRVEYPENGRPLAPGRYYWRVIPLDEESRPRGRASQTWFESSGWSAPSYEAAVPPTGDAPDADGERASPPGP